MSASVLLPSRSKTSEVLSYCLRLADNAAGAGVEAAEDAVEGVVTFLPRAIVGNKIQKDWQKNIPFKLGNA